MADAQGVTIEFPEKDRREFARMMEMFERRLGKDAGESLRWGMYHAASTAAASTKKAKKQRRLLKNKGDNPSFPPEEYAYFVKKWYQGAQEPYHIFIKRTNAKERKIKRAGLAKNAWKWGLAKIHMRAGRRTGYGKPKSVEVDDQHKSTVDPYIEMTSTLGYAQQALKQGGKQSVNTIMRRASNKMRKYMERRTGEAIQERNL